MSTEYNRLSGDAIREAGKEEISDYFMFGSNYFSCGFYMKNLVPRRHKCTSLIEIVSSLFQILINQPD